MAPDFTLRDQSGARYHLATILKNRPVVLFFYPGDGVVGCTIQLSLVRDDWAKFVHAGIVVYGINHGNAASHEAFAKKLALPFPLLIDTQKKVSSLYGAVKKQFVATVIASTALGIDRTGRIRYRKHGMPKNADILKAMSSKIHS